VCPAGASVCLSDVQPRLGISAGRDNRKIWMVPALGEKQAEVMAGSVTCCVAQHQQAPPFADQLQRAGGGALLILVEALS